MSIKSTGLILDLQRYVSPDVSPAPSSTTWADKSRYNTPGTITGATWTRLPSGLWVLSYASGNYVSVTCPQANFTSHAFTASVWVYPTNLGTGISLFSRGAGFTDGWLLNSGPTGLMNFVTNQLGVRQQNYSVVGTMVINKWQSVWITRAGTVGKIFLNAVNVIAVSQNIINPITTARTLKIGIDDDTVAFPFVGLLAPPRILSYALTPGQILQQYNAEKGWFGL